MKAVNREVLLSLWKVHILHHAGEGPVHGQWILTELRRHGYEISPGTLYPLLNRMARLGWLECKAEPDGGRRARKDYRLTPEGRKVLTLIRGRITELPKGDAFEARRKPKPARGIRDAIR
jgi:PadR family transcriptional regulator, regulatory protein PadR